MRINWFEDKLSLRINCLRINFSRINCPRINWFRINCCVFVNSIRKGTNFCGRQALPLKVPPSVMPNSRVPLAIPSRDFGVIIYFYDPHPNKDDTFSSHSMKSNKKRKAIGKLQCQFWPPEGDLHHIHKKEGHEQLPSSTQLTLASSVTVKGLE